MADPSSPSTPRPRASTQPTSTPQRPSQSKPRHAVAPRRLPAAAFAALDAVADRITPDDPALVDWCRNYARQHRTRLAGDLWLLEQHAGPGARVLEYGAVPLLMTGALKQRDYEVSAVDIGPARFAGAIAELGVDVRQCDVEREPVPFEDGAFDVILFNEIFEHLRIDPIFTLREARRVLRPGGKLLLSTPNLRSFRGLKNLLLHNEGHAASGNVYRQYEKLQRLGHMGHVREYTTKEVVDFLGHVGFVTEQLVFRGGYGRGVVGLLERLVPRLRPFFSIVAVAVADEGPA